MLAGVAAALLTVGVAAAEPEAKGPACREVALVSTFEGAVLRRLSPSSRMNTVPPFANAFA